MESLNLLGLDFEASKGKVLSLKSRIKFTRYYTTTAGGTSTQTLIFACALLKATHCLF